MRRFRLTRLRVAVAVAAATFAGVGVAYAASVTVTSGQLWAGAQTLTKGTCSATESDATIDQGNATTNSSNQSTLTVRAGWTFWIFTLARPADALIGFDLGSCAIPSSGGVDTATLTLQVTAHNGSAETIYAYPITSAWNAATVTWNTAPSVGATPDFSFSSAVGTYTFPVTAKMDAAIKGGSFYGWELVDSANANSTTTLGGNASAQAPTLTLNYEK